MAYTIGGAAIGHTVCHYVNYAAKPEAMEALFAGSLSLRSKCGLRSNIIALITPRLWYNCG